MNDENVKSAIVIERSLDAPAGLVWEMWTQPAHFKNWYGPQGFAVPVAEIDLRVGGRRLVCMEMRSDEEARTMCTAGEHTLIEPASRLRYTEAFSDSDGTLLPPSAMGMPGDEPLITEVTVELESQDGGTLLRLTHAGVPADSPGAAGWEQALDKLEKYLPQAG